MSDLKKLKLEDLKVGMYVEFEQLLEIRGVYIFIKTGVNHLLNGEIVLITRSLNSETDELGSKPDIGVFYIPEGQSLGSV